MKFLTKTNLLLFVVLFSCVYFFSLQFAYAARDNVPDNFVQSWGNDGSVTARIQNGSLVFDTYPTSLNIQVNGNKDFGMYYNTQLIVSANTMCTQSRSVTCLGSGRLGPISNTFNFRYSSSESYVSVMSDGTRVFGDLFATSPFFGSGAGFYNCPVSKINAIKALPQDQNISREFTYTSSPSTQLVTWQNDVAHDNRSCTNSYQTNTFKTICENKGLYQCDDDPFGSGDWRWNSNFSIGLNGVDPNAITRVRFIDVITAFNEAHLDDECALNRPDSGPHQATRERGVNLVGQCPVYTPPSSLTVDGLQSGNHLVPPVGSDRVTKTISWQFTQGANLASLRISDLNDGRDWANVNCSGNSNITTGDVCVENYNGSTYSYTFISGHSYSIWVHQGSAGCSSSVDAVHIALDVPNRPASCTINASQCGTLTGTATDPDGGNVLVRFYHDGIFLKNANFNTTFTAVADQLTHTITAYPIDVQTGGLGTPCSSSYMKYNPNNYANRCDSYYSMTVNGTNIPWGEVNENEFGYLDGSCSSVTDPVMGYSYHAGDCAVNNLKWKARVKGIMDAGGTVNMQVVGHKDNHSVSFVGPCNTPSQSSTVGQEVFAYSTDYECSVPEGINLVESSITFNTKNDNIGKSEDVTASIKCTKLDTSDIRPGNDVVVNKGELEACFTISNPDFPNNQQNIYYVSDTWGVSKCDGRVNFDILDYVYDGERWGPLHGVLNLTYEPDQTKTSERFEYSGDVIVNPPPGFEEYIFPSF